MQCSKSCNGMVSITVSPVIAACKRLLGKWCSATWHNYRGPEGPAESVASGIGTQDACQRFGHEGIWCFAALKSLAFFEDIPLSCRCVVFNCGRYYHPRCLELKSDDMHTLGFVWYVPYLAILPAHLYYTILQQYSSSLALFLMDSILCHTDAMAWFLCPTKSARPIACTETWL